MWRLNSIAQSLLISVEVRLLPVSLVSSIQLTRFGIEKNKERAILQSHAQSATPELKACEHRLKCIVEGIEKDQLLVRFSHIDKDELEREFSFVLDVSSRAYRGQSPFIFFFSFGIVTKRCVDGVVVILVLTSTPILPTLPIYVEELNESRDVYAFIKQVRRAFEELVQQGR